MRYVDQRGPFEPILIPMRDIKGEVIINKDAKAVPLRMSVGQSLILTVTIIYYFDIHFNIKVITDQRINISAQY